MFSLVIIYIHTTFYRYFIKHPETVFSTYQHLLKNQFTKHSIDSANNNFSHNNFKNNSLNNTIMTNWAKESKGRLLVLDFGFEGFSPSDQLNAYQSFES